MAGSTGQSKKNIGVRHMVAIKSLETVPSSCAKCPFISINRYLRSKWLNEPVPWWECKLTGERDINNINRGRMAQCPLQEIENGNNAI